jgi:hypothetical protein
MRHTNRVAASFLGATAMLSGAMALGASPAAAERPAVPDTVTSAWQHRKVNFNYFGVTSLYTCDGLEGQVRRILLHFGARKDMRVRAGGCLGPNEPSHSAWVDADFYALAPAADAGAADSVQGHWAELDVTARRPSFLGDGDCELVEEMKELMIKSFSLRGVEYRTSCVPHQLTMDGFRVKGEALKMTAAKRGFERG